MSGFKNNPRVTVTVRPDGTYYVEKQKPAPKQQLAKTEIRPVFPTPGSSQHLREPRSPVAVAVTSTLKDFAGIALAAKAAVPALGKYGVVAAIGFGVLSALSASKPAPVPVFKLRRIKRIP